MKTVIVPKKPQETETTIDLDLAQNRPLFIKEKRTQKLIGMIHYDFECGWCASTGMGGLYGYHKNLKTFLSMYFNERSDYELVVDIQL